MRLWHDPSCDHIEVVDSTKGGAIPKEFIPAVCAGLRAAGESGGSFGFPFVKIRAELLDDNHHEVDSSAMAFEAAGALAFRMATDDNAVLLEPIMRIEVEGQEKNTGDVSGGKNRTATKAIVIAIEAGRAVIAAKERRKM